MTQVKASIGHSGAASARMPLFEALFPSNGDIDLTSKENVDAKALLSAQQSFYLRF